MGAGASFPSLGRALSAGHRLRQIAATQLSLSHHSTARTPTDGSVTSWCYESYHKQIASSVLLEDICEEDKPAYASLLEMLNTALGLRYLHSYLYSSKLPENPEMLDADCIAAALYFWTEAEEFRSISARSWSYRVSHARRIFNKYMLGDARMSLVFVSSEMREDAATRLDGGILPNNDFIHPAMTECLKFIYSSLYAPFMADLEVRERYEEEKKITYNAVRLEDFDSYQLLGSGAFGRVVHASKRSTGKYYALKIASKRRMLQIAKQDKWKLTNERDVYIKASHPFIVKMDYAFATDRFIVLVLQLSRGGTLEDAAKRSRGGCLSESAALFYCAEIVCALLHLHSLGLMYRDLKPSNVLVGDDGHILLADMGGVGGFRGIEQEVTAVGSPNVGFGNGSRRQTVTGTKGYMAPEVYMLIGSAKASRQNMGYSASVDWWSLGSTLYKLLTGKRPSMLNSFRPSFLRQAAERNDKVQLPLIGSAYNKIRSPATRGLITCLMNPSEKMRLGSGVNGEEELKSHPAFSHIDWVALENKRVPPPWIPSLDQEKWDSLAPIKLDDIFAQADAEDELRGKKTESWHTTLDDEEQGHWYNFAYVSPTALRIEMGIANEQKALESEFKAHQLLNPSQ